MRVHSIADHHFVARISVVVLSIAFLTNGMCTASATECDRIITNTLSPEATGPITELVGSFLCGSPSISLSAPYDAYLSPAWRTANCGVPRSSLTEDNARLIGIAALQGDQFRAWNVCEQSRNDGVDWAVSHNSTRTTFTLFPKDASVAVVFTGLYAKNASCAQDSLGKTVSQAGLPITCQHSAAATVTFIAETTAGILSRTYNNNDETVVPQCADKNPVPGRDFLGNSILLPSSEFNACFVKMLPPPRDCSKEPTIDARLECSRRYQCFQDVFLGRTQLESARLSCKQTGPSSPACNNYATLSLQPRYTATIEESCK